MCTGGDATTADSVTLSEGQNATCTITNTAIPSTLTLVKVVDDGESGATAVPADWTLTAANGPTTVTGPGNSASVTNQEIPVGDYALSEDGPDGYTASDWTCVGATVTADSFTVGLGADVTCTITNTAIAPTLTLIKVVDNGTTGADATATDWTLTADGPVTLSGATGDATITAADAKIGSYDLSEAGPSGYDATDWTCTGATSSTATSVDLSLADEATCTITNTAQPSLLTLVKTVTNDDGGDARRPTGR